MQIWKKCDKKWRHNDLITENNRKIGTSEKPTKLYIIRKVLTRTIQKCRFCQIWTFSSKGMGINPIRSWLYFTVLKVQGVFRDPLKISGPIQGSPIKLCTVIVLRKVYQNT